MESGDAWEKHFEGRDVPEEYRIMGYPQPTVERDAAPAVQTAAIPLSLLHIFTQNVKDLLSCREVENIFENSDFVLMLNQAQGCLLYTSPYLKITCC